MEVDPTFKTSAFTLGIYRTRLTTQLDRPTSSVGPKKGVTTGEPRDSATASLATRRDPATPNERARLHNAFVIQLIGLALVAARVESHG